MDNKPFKMTLVSTLVFIKCGSRSHTRITFIFLSQNLSRDSPIKEFCNYCRKRLDEVNSPIEMTVIITLFLDSKVSTAVRPWLLKIFCKDCYILYSIDIKFTVLNFNDFTINRECDLILVAL